jgi:hypothetical protein
MTTLPLTTLTAAAPQVAQNLFLDLDKLKKIGQLIEDSGACLQCSTASAAEQGDAFKYLLAVNRAAQQAHKGINKPELRSAMDMGHYLIRTKASLQHGEYGPFLKGSGITTQDASRFWAVAINWDEIVRKGYTDYSVSKVVEMLKQDKHNAEQGDMRNAEFKERADYASEASGREAELLMRLREANRNIQRLESELARYQAKEAPRTELRAVPPVVAPVEGDDSAGLATRPPAAGLVHPAGEAVVFNWEEGTEQAPRTDPRPDVSVPAPVHPLDFAVFRPLPPLPSLGQPAVEPPVSPRREAATVEYAIF